MIELRDYQADTVTEILRYWREGGGNPLAELATGLGKSVVIASLQRDLLTSYPDMRVLNLVHVRELVQQNAQTLLRLWPDAPLGIYSAGLGRRDAHHRITFASIQSVYRKARELGPRDLVLIDEAHLVPAAGEGMYKTLLEALREERPDMRVCGFTATGYRLDTGRLDEGDERLFDQIVYKYGIREGIGAGWLSPLICKATVNALDVRSVAKRGGEFIPGALEAAVDQDPITRAAVGELVAFGAERKSWLVFCAGVKHAHHVRDAIRAHGVSCGTITGDTPSHERSHLVAEFKAGRLRCLTNANVLTTGFDAPGVDLIAMLRPTLSTGLYVQMVGRGTRLAEGKANCMVLDFAGNVRRHGPVDTVEVGSKKGGGKGEAKVEETTVRAKECPNCHSLNPINAGECRDCGHEWPVEIKPKHEATADAETPILSTRPALSKSARQLVPDEHPVMRWDAYRHVKFGSPDSMKVTYFAGLMSFPEWIAFEHQGFARSKAERWWILHGGAMPIPASVNEGIDRFGELAMPEVILTRKEGSWWTVVGRRFPRNEADEGAAA